MSSIPTILIPNLRLSKVRWGVRIKNRSLQPPVSMQELTINLPNNSRLRGLSPVSYTHLTLPTRRTV